MLDEKQQIYLSLSIAVDQLRKISFVATIEEKKRHDELQWDIANSEVLPFQMISFLYH